LKEAAAGIKEVELVMLHKKNQRVDWEPLLAGISCGKAAIEYGANHTIFSQGDRADSVFYLRQGKVKLAVTSPQDRDAIVAILGDGEFFGEGCLAGQALRIATATAIADCTLIRIEKALMVRMLHELHDVSEMFVTHLLSRSIRYEADLVDQFFDSSEKRLARRLLLLAHFDKESGSETAVSRVNQEDLAQTVGTTRSRINHFMNKFRKLGFIDYSDNGWVTVRNGLLRVVLYDDAEGH
jgi:CRP/FNR family cyclic AMP-dependent transcriptional regulator